MRAALLAILCALLSGCWVAERSLFSTADFVQPDGLEGRFVSENAAGDEQGTVDLVRRADGLIDGTVTKKGETAPQTSPAGFVAIPGGSRDYLLMVQRSPEGKDGELYLIGRWRDDRLEAFWPQCAGTPDMAGMKRETAEPIPEPLCTFASKEAVLRAALAAERDLEAKHMFDPQIVGRLKRPEDAEPPAGN
jgi:hypothetical protein